MYTYRISKYNPKYRTENGVYTKEEWTEFSDIGKEFEGKVLTKEEYERMESMYIDTLATLLEENDILKLKVCKIQNFRNVKFENKIIKINQVYNLQDLKEIFRFILRGELWAKFKNEDGIYVDFGWDYYVYIGIARQSKKLIAIAKKNKLYIEKYPEPDLE